MKRLLMTTLISAALAGAAGARAECPKADAAMMALSLEDFDQTDQGWRSLDEEGCEHQAADAIRRYREINAGDVGANTGSLLWHEGQLRAAGGETDEAIRLMLRSREQDSEVTRPYTDATIAFLRRDRAALIAARGQLVSLPVPEAFARAAARYAETYPDHPPLRWPLNLDIVDGLIACFDRPYREAYGCRESAGGEEN